EGSLDDKVGCAAPEEVSEQEKREPQAERPLRVCRNPFALVRPHAEQPNAECHSCDLDACRRPQEEERHAGAGDAAAGSEILRQEIVRQKTGETICMPLRKAALPSMVLNPRPTT